LDNFVVKNKDEPRKKLGAMGAVISVCYYLDWLFQIFHL